MRKLTGQKVRGDIALMAAILDRLNWLAWANSEDGRKNRRRPESVLAKIMGDVEEKHGVDMDAFDAIRASYLRGTEE